MAINPLTEVRRYQRYYPWERDKFFERAGVIGLDSDDPVTYAMLESSLLTACNLRYLLADTVNTTCDPRSPEIYLHNPIVTDRTLDHFLRASAEADRRDMYKYGLCAMARAIELHNRSRWDPKVWLERELQNIPMIGEDERLQYLSLLLGISLIASTGGSLREWRTIGVRCGKELSDSREWDSAKDDWRRAVEPYLSISEDNLVMV